ncbi:MAG: hypothetical protein J4224_04615 [Candidatus Diapherotrites archaeon]|uniref:Uncharacterized protein n=1 Tax=Candidatus Iainarchaeum sp. TaxID=3101447 RepID=A0A7J4IU52_9ARCH|nr:MAG: hypothetical protein QT03_C0001G0784 [archaeon GW2011_AR10]MBS3059677.1 hypothetical protein [Candidatus Diapherotrites archaeon]HIH08962.1 hypothetical protein [Candidatus Diapherotrites archaeon]
MPIKKPVRRGLITSLKEKTQKLREWRASKREKAALRKKLKIQLDRINKNISVLEGRVYDQEHHPAYTGSVHVEEAKDTIRQLKKQKGFLEKQIKQLKQSKK